jgi:lipopolysaccharide/colanic/teichoic acid biosynthesis glycosyltransferase
MRLYKFRTMRGAHGADGRRIPDADRLSVVGATLRRMRLDELPQLVNVLTGSMSFVGPRPLLPVDQQADMPERLAIRPGLTGWAQVKGGRDISPADKAALDLWYIKNASLLVDLWIVMETVRMVLLGERTDRGAINQAWLALRPTGQRGQSSLGTAYRDSLDCAPILASKKQLGGDGGLTYAQRSRVL